MQPPRRRLGNEPWRVSREHRSRCQHPPRMLVPRIRPSQGEGKFCTSSCQRASNRASIQNFFNPFAERRMLPFAAMKGALARANSDFSLEVPLGSQAAIRSCEGIPTDHSTNFAFQWVRTRSVSATVGSKATNQRKGDRDSREFWAICGTVVR